MGRASRTTSPAPHGGEKAKLKAKEVSTSVVTKTSSLPYGVKLFLSGNPGVVVFSNARGGVVTIETIRGSLEAAKWAHAGSTWTPTSRLKAEIQPYVWYSVLIRTYSAVRSLVQKIAMPSPSASTNRMCVRRLSAMEFESAAASNGWGWPSAKMTTPFSASAMPAGSNCGPA